MAIETCHMLSRDEAIKIIQELFPADSRHMHAADTGRRLLDQARREVEDWRNEPTPVLLRYAWLCAEEDRRQQVVADRFLQSRG